VSGETVIMGRERIFIREDVHVTVEAVCVSHRTLESLVEVPIPADAEGGIPVSTGMCEAHYARNLRATVVAVIQAV
jgi:hypothetical protein